ncbi:hypothetical protein M0P65_00735 [Candidatus Gracilibacteria bacterium]|nr:hypothetical protein [Candidatus Gracilibacteria bacterium]
MEILNKNMGDIAIYLIFFAIVALFIWRKPDYKENMLYILNNLKTVYINFLHWNISKIIIRIYSILAGLIISSPFLALSVYLIFKLSKVFNTQSLSLFINSGDIDANLLTAFISNIWSVLFLILILVLVFGFFVFTFMYGDFLIQNIYKGYIEKTKIPYSKNLYFSWTHIYKFLGVLTRKSLYLLIPVLILLGGILVLAILYSTGKITNDPTNPNMLLGAVSLLYFIGTSIFLAYLFIRLSFSYISFIYTDRISLPAKHYVEKSFELTKGNIFKILFLLVPFLALYSFITLILDILNLSNFLYFILTFLTMSSILYVVIISIYNILNKKKKVLQKQYSVL